MLRRTFVKLIVATSSYFVLNKNTETASSTHIQDDWKVKDYKNFGIKLTFKNGFLHDSEHKSEKSLTQVFYNCKHPMVDSFGLNFEQPGIFTKIVIVGDDKTHVWTNHWMWNDNLYCMEEITKDGLIVKRKIIQNDLWNQLTIINSELVATKNDLVLMLEAE